MSEKKLTKRQQIFVEAMADPNTKTQTEAAIKAGCNPKTASVNASQTLLNPKILAAIEKRKAEMAQYANVYADLVFGGTALRATASLDDCLDAGGNFDIKKARQTGVIHQIKRITRTPNKYGETVSVELYGKDAAQDKLGSYLGLEQMPKANEATLDEMKQALIANLKAQGWEDARIERAVQRPVAAMLPQELGEAG